MSYILSFNISTSNTNNFVSSLFRDYRLIATMWTISYYVGEGKPKKIMCNILQVYLNIDLNCQFCNNSNI